MPFWSKGKNESQPPARDFSDGSADFQESVSVSPSSAPMSMSGGGGGGNEGMAELQQFATAIQQSALIQSTITTLSEKAFEACITKPSSSLSGKEAACVQAVTMKWLDTNQFMVGRLQKKMSSGQESSFN